jgi:hypothetical protein
MLRYFLKTKWYIYFMSGNTMRARYRNSSDLRALFVTSIMMTFFAVAAGVFPIPAADSNAGCDIQRGSCRLVTNDGTAVELDIQPKPVKAMTDLDFMITITRDGTLLKDTLISLDLSMPGMFMGRNRPVLKQVQPGRYEGKGIVTKCPSGRKTWQAEITVERDGKTAVVDFVFEVT